MNIDDVDEVPLPEGKTPLQAIFEKQGELMNKYHPIEVSNGADVPEMPWNIDDKRVQWRLKHFFWCTTEEIGEALEHYITFENWRERMADEKKLRHFFEELADSLHFLTEATIIAGITAEEVDGYIYWEMGEQSHEPERETVELLCGRFIFQLGVTANLLKNKPWKTTHMPTDQGRFHKELLVSWLTFSHIWREFGITDEEVWGLYARKFAVNRFRQDSNY